MASNKFFKGIVIGAIIGGALSLLDRNTRSDVLEKGKAIGRNVKENIKNPKATMESLQGKFHQLKQTYEEINKDVQFIVEKAAEIKEIGTETTKMVAETKKAFEKGAEADKEL